MKYADLVKTFSWDEVKNYFMHNGGLIHTFLRRSSDPAVIRFDKDWNRQVMSFYEVTEKALKLAGWLRDNGVKPGDVVAVLASKKAEQVVILLATWIIGGVYQPLFTAFGPLAIEARIKDKKPSVMFIQEDQYDKVKDLGIKLVSFPGKAGNATSFDEALSSEPIKDVREPNLNEMAILIYTSGTTGEPKGAMVNYRLLYNTYVYMKYGLGLEDNDTFWNGADPGWAYGLYYGVMGPLMFGKPVVFLDRPFSPEDTLKLLEDLGVTNFTFAPTAYRLIMGTVKDMGKYNLRVRKLSSAGEPLNPEVIRWFQERLGVPVKDHYGQSEVGMVVYNGWGYEAELKPGSMGLPAPGYEVTVIDDALAVKTTSEGFCFMGYINAPERTKNAFKGEWYLTGDTARIDEEGYVWFIGRQDDVVKVSGYRVGPFEIESVLIKHPAVLESAAVAFEDPVRGHVFKAFVVLKPGYKPSDELAKELINFVRENYSKHVHLHEVIFVDSLPKTESGKIQRYKLRQAYSK